MKASMRLRRAAQTDYNEAFDFYESRESGLGVRFLESLSKVLDRIADQPDRYAETLPGIREADVPGWPYYVVYQVEDDAVWVVAVFHAARDSATWQRRI